MRYLSSLPLRMRLALSFALVVVLLMLVGAFALVQLARLNRDTREIAEQWVPRAHHAATIKIAAGAIRVAQFQHLAYEPGEEDGAVGIADKAAEAEAEVAKQRATLTQALAAYAPLVSSDDERAQLDEFRTQWEAYEASSQIFMDVMKSGARDVAMSMMTEQARIEFDAANAALDRLIEIGAAGVAAASERSASNYGTTLTLVIAAIVVAVIAGALAATLLIRQIMRQLGGDPADVKRTVEQIADGELGGRIPLAHGDRDSLLAATKRMQDELLKLVEAQQQMHAQHAAGALAHRIETGRFRGVYAELATAVNTLATTHIDVSRRAVEVIQRYARGDFSIDMDRLPGEQARITEAVDGVKQQLGAIKDETLKLADAAGRGQFEVRGDASRFEYAFRDIIDGLNRLMATSELGLHSVGSVLAALATGDLTQRMDGDFQGMFAQLRDNANDSVAQLSDIVRRIKSAAEMIDSAAGEIASGNQDLSTRTESQASSLEETAAAVEQLAGTVNQNAANAKEANTLAANAGDVAGRGGAVVDQVVTTMGAISTSSNKIADIIGVIDGIAFQTNILALNAAVEAARAGDQGRGFAVVASEVRALAQRSADAAKEIKTLIGESVRNVTSGTELVGNAGRTMQEIVTAVRRVNDIMGEIAGASSEQSTGIGQVNQAIVQIDATTQQNAALVEQAAAAARSLNEQARELSETVGAFRV